MLRVGTPGGHVVDFEHDVDEVATRDERGPHLPMRHTHARRGVGLGRLDHVNVRTANLAPALAYWQEELQFAASERQIDDRG